MAEKEKAVIEERPYDYKGIWLHLGVNIGGDGKIRCPWCNWILTEGEYPTKVQTFICPHCKKESTFQRIT